MDDPIALIAGVTGVSGRALAHALLAAGGWQVVGLSRRPSSELEGVDHLTADLSDEVETRRALSGLAPTHVFYCSWARAAEDGERSAINAAMVDNVLNAAADGGQLRHVALVTGLSHYMGGAVDTPFIESEIHPPGGNSMYFAQEDAMFAVAKARGFTWSVARPGTIIGYAPGNAMNLGTAVAVYATLSRETGRPFVFPGSAHYYEGLADVTDARLLARHLIWEATTPSAANLAFNVVNGDLFRWNAMWARIAEYFGTAVSPYPGGPTSAATLLADAEDDWQRIVARHGLKPTRLSEIAPFWHLDLDLNRSRDTMGDMRRSRERGFLEFQPSWTSFADLFARLKSERLVP